MTHSEEPSLDQPPPNVQTRPPRVQRRIGKQMWAILAVVFITMVLLSILVRTGML